MNTGAAALLTAACACATQITPRCFYNPTLLAYTPATVLVSTGMRVLSVYTKEGEKDRANGNEEEKERGKQTDR